MNKTDMQLKRDVEEELSWDPKLNAAQIGVSVEHGKVMLNGVVDTYAEKWAAGDAAWRVGGVQTVEQELSVKLIHDHQRQDRALADAAANALLWDVFVPSTVTASVQNGAVTLGGQVGWNYQRTSAERAVRYLTGVVSVHNDITLTPKASAEKVKEQIEGALKRQAELDSKSIHIEASGSKITLTGSCSSWQAMDSAETAAWAAPGVTDVIDRLTIS